MGRKVVGAAVAVLLGMLLFAGPASAQADYVGAPPPRVANVDIPQSRGVQVLSQSGSRAPAGTLALTGGDILGLLGLAAACVGAGVILASRARSVRA